MLIALQSYFSDRDRQGPSKGKTFNLSGKSRSEVKTFNLLGKSIGTFLPASLVRPMNHVASLRAGVGLGAQTCQGALNAVKYGGAKRVRFRLRNTNSAE